jgi:hypothetical protein
MMVEAAGKIMVAGTVATLGSLELRLIVRPPFGAPVPDSCSVRFCRIAFVAIVRLGGTKPSVRPGVTCTIWLVDGNPYADAVMAADPTLTAVTFGCVDCHRHVGRKKDRLRCPRASW